MLRKLLFFFTFMSLHFKTTFQGFNIHVVNNPFSCIDLIFCDNQNLISNHGADLSIYEKCHLNIIFGKLNIHILFPLSYVLEVSDYSKVSIENIQMAVLIFDWKKAFENLAVDEKVNLLNETLLNIFRNYISNKKTNLTIVILRD